MDREPIERRLRVGTDAPGQEVELALFEWPGDGPTVLLVHANGFHSRCWDAVVRELPGVRVLAVDLRGHGRSDKRPPYTWDRFGEDVLQLVATLDVPVRVAVGHSLGGHVVTQVAARLPGKFGAIVLVDPVILTPERYATRDERSAVGEHTLKRKSRFESPEAMFERFRGRAPFRTWREDVLRSYCFHGLERNLGPEGGYVLRCPPEVEALIYAGASWCDVRPLLAGVRVPVTVLRARGAAADRPPGDLSTSPTWPALASQFPRGRDVHLPELSHFIPMERPELVAKHVLEALAQA